ncbi:hypothetical protein CK203_016744 [Vitis vinifera]|uniref:Uncharacterized protein n=1 Tax=Vitis vinifera TaxID=29760 RepID=A0A438J2J6_VITVI|nr:hypothetical protein CK203_016744 [Vitis vinifera]
MWRSWVSSPGGVETAPASYKNFTCSSFKDIQSLCKEENHCSSNLKRPSIFPPGSGCDLGPAKLVLNPNQPGTESETGACAAAAVCVSYRRRPERGGLLHEPKSGAQDLRGLQHRAIDLGGGFG